MSSSATSLRAIELAEEKVHPHGSLQYHFVSMGSISTRVPSGMQLHSVMVGRLQTYQPPVYVAPISQSSTLSPAQGVLSQSFGIMK